MKKIKIVFLLVLCSVLFISFYFYLLYLTSALDCPLRPLGWQLLLPVLLGFGAFWAFCEVLRIVMSEYVEPFLKKRFPKWG